MYIVAAGEYSDHGRLQFYISGTRTCLALTMHAILTVSVTQSDLVRGKKWYNFQFVTLVRLHAFLYCTLCVCSLSKSLNENCGLLQKWFTTSPQWTACNQLTINTPFHSLRRERALPYFVLGGRARTKHQWPARTEGSAWEQHRSSMSRQRATTQIKSSSDWPWLYSNSLHWKCSAFFCYLNQNRYIFPQVAN